VNCDKTAHKSYVWAYSQNHNSHGGPKNGFRFFYVARQRVSSYVETNTNANVSRNREQMELIKSTLIIIYQY